ncbi:MAG: hypothetical protein ACI4S2_10615, partial [Lachnospiraceae bacterium]
GYRMVGKEGKMKRHLPDWVGLASPKQEIEFYFNDENFSLYKKKIRVCEGSIDGIRAYINLKPRRIYEFSYDIKKRIMITNKNTAFLIFIDEDTFYKFFNIIKPIKE